MPRKLSHTRPIITLTTDFGLSDSYVAEMKGAILKNCADVRLIDVTHQVPRHDILQAAIMLERAISAFPPKTVHLAVVDPGVGSARKLIIAQIAKQWIVCPDNGLITWALRVLGSGKVFEITWRPKAFSATFHGRDILAPIAARLAAKQSLRGLAIRMQNPILLDTSPCANGVKNGRIIHIDTFGNCTTNLRMAKQKAEVMVHGVRVQIARTYADVSVGKPIALLGSSGLLEIAIREGSARNQLKLKVGDKVVLE